MTVKGLKGGSKLRHIQGNNLKALEDMLELLPYKTDIINVNKVGGNWYIHFYIPELVFEAPSTVKEEAKETVTKKVVKRRK